MRTSDEDTKSGVEVEEALKIIDVILKDCKKLQFKGLMTVGKDGDLDAFKVAYFYLETR